MDQALGGLCLGPRLRGRAERFFDADLGAARVEVSPLVIGGRARPGRVVLGEASIRHPQALRLLGHELAHVVQLDRGAGGDADASDGSGLEIEAAALGAAFSRGDVHGRVRLRARLGPTLPSLDVAGTHVDGVGGLSAAARAALGLIPAAGGFVAWAAAQTRRFSFEDEPTLVHEVLTGLHDTPWIVLPRLGLTVSPFRLFQLPVTTLQLLAKAEGPEHNGVIEVQARRALAGEGLVTEDELRTVDGFLADVGLTTAPIFRTGSLGDRLALHQLLADSSGAPAQSLPLQREAASYAVREAPRVVDFVDRYRTYLVESARSGLLEAEPNVRATAVEQLEGALRPHVFGALLAPTVRGALPDAARIGQVVGELVAQSQMLGFARLAAGVARLVEDGGFQREQADDANALVGSYRQRATSFFANRPLTGPLVSQDGRRASYHASDEAAEGELELDSNGQLVLRRFRTRRADPPVAPRPASRPGKPPARESRP